MKYMVISDIHGNIDALNTVLNIYQKEHCNKLLILGDLINYGIDLNIEENISELSGILYNISSLNATMSNTLCEFLS